MIKYLIILATAFSFITCNKPANDSPDEDYKKIFGKKEIPDPEFDYDLMPILPCEPQLSQKGYIYSGKELNNKRDYIVTLKFWFKEEQTFSGSSMVQSKVDLRYIDENKKLSILSTKDRGEGADFSNDVVFSKQFKVQSGFPLYLGIFGSGFDSFQMNASIQAVSEDGLIKTPILKYYTKLYTDGYSDNFNYCGKIILP